MELMLHNEQYWLTSLEGELFFSVSLSILLFVSIIRLRFNLVRVSEMYRVGAARCRVTVAMATRHVG